LGIYHLKICLNLIRIHSFHSFLLNRWPKEMLGLHKTQMLFFIIFRQQNTPREERYLSALGGNKTQTH